MPRAALEVDGPLCASPLTAFASNALGRPTRARISYKLVNSRASARALYDLQLRVCEAGRAGQAQHGLMYD